MIKKLLLKTIAALYCAIVLFVFSSCGQKSGSDEIDPAFAQYISAFTYGNISPESAIQIELAQEMPAVELNAEIKEKLFSFSPSLKGKAYWVNSTTVQFVPEPGELKPGKTYKAKFNLDKILKSKKNSPLSNSIFTSTNKDFRPMSFLIPPCRPTICLGTACR